MEKVRELARTLNILPRLQLGIKLDKGGIKTTGPHKVKFLQEPTIVMGKDFEGKPRKEMKFIVESEGVKYTWNVPILNKEGQPNYLIERLMNIEVNDERTLEMKKKGIRNYIDIREEDEDNEPPMEDERELMSLEEEFNHEAAK